MQNENKYAGVAKGDDIGSLLRLLEMMHFGIAMASQISRHGKVCDWLQSMMQKARDGCL